MAAGALAGARAYIAERKEGSFAARAICGRAPKEHEFEFKIVDKNTLVGLVTRCIAFDAVKKTGTTEVYQCSCVIRHGAWLEAFGLNGETFIRKSMMKGDNVCEIVAKIKEWKT